MVRDRAQCCCCVGSCAHARPSATRRRRTNCEFVHMRDPALRAGAGLHSHISL
jgi:hypothetical protein